MDLRLQEVRLQEAGQGLREANICGIVASLATKNLPVHLLEHRGVRHQIYDVPGGRDGGAVAHVRLPIVGLAESYDQPVAHGQWVVAFVGEVLDFRDQDPSAECDLATVVRAWADDGPGGLAHRDGFWSVVAVDVKHRVLHVLCDYLAQKPMYYRRDYRACASELDAAAAFGPVTPDDVYFSSCVKWGYCPEVERTPYAEVKRVLPGEHVEITSTGYVTREVVDPLRRAGGDLRCEVEAAVKRRVLASDVPVACLVSGGLDSSIVYTLAKRHGDVRPYYVKDSAHPDVAEQLAVSAVTAPAKVTEVDWRDCDLEHALDVMQEPIDLGSLVPQVAMAEQVQERVCLTGDGADELFGGYGRAQRYDSQASDVWQELVAWHLPRLDRVMMRHRVEVRSPFLARRVAQVALSLPWAQRRGKKVLRELFRSDLPGGIADGPKVPLRTVEVQRDRESHSLKLVKLFRERRWPLLRVVA